jgi:hypothetical protein
MYSIGRDVTLVQKGYTERLLCADCETLLSKYENEFGRLWREAIPEKANVPVTYLDDDVLSVDVPDYTQFKLFHLSILWRAAVSGFKTHAGISLGRYDREIADSILKGDPGGPGDFPVLGSVIVDEDRHPLPIVAPLVEGKGRLETSILPALVWPLRMDIHCLPF